LVVGNPANTNALIAARNAPDLDPRQFTAMTRLDHNRAVGILADKVGAASSDVDGAVIWGNHSPTQYPDLHGCTIAGKPALDLIERDYYENTYIPQVAKRGAAIIDARGASSAASAAQAAINHIHDWVLGTQGKTVSMAVPSDGSYGIEPGVVYSFPVVCEGGDYKIVQGIEISDFSRGLMTHTDEELRSEKAAVEELLLDQTEASLAGVSHPVA